MADPRIERNIPALTPEECALLARQRVLIVGCGGLGGYLLELMLRLGVGQIRVCDGDVFDPTNRNRQLLSTGGNLGRNKAMAALSRSLELGTLGRVEAIPTPMTRDNALDLVRGCDAVLDGLDNASSRRVLAQACSEAGIPYIFGAVSGWVAQAAVSMPGDGLVDLLYPEGVTPEERSVLSFTPALCASIQASLCALVLTGRPVEPGKLYHMDLLHQEFDTIPLT